jgi:hypothetical protein
LATVAEFLLSDLSIFVNAASINPSAKSVQLLLAWGWKSMKSRAAFRGVITAMMLLLGTAMGLTALMPPGGSVAAAESAAPLLVVDGAVIDGKAVAFDLTQLKSLPSITVKTMTPWTDGENEFEGVRLRDLLEHLGAKGREVIAAATDDYAATIPMEDIAGYDVIVAYAMNGKPMPSDNKGPLWVIYPFSSYHGLQKDLYYARCVWQLTRLTVQ